MEKQVKDVDDMSEEEQKDMAKFLGKKAVEVKAPTDNYLEGIEAMAKEPRGRVVKGGNNNLFI